MVKTEVINNICLIEIYTKNKCFNALEIIKSSLSDNKISPLFMSRSAIGGRGENLTFAIDPDDLFPMMNSIGSIRHKVGIRNYSINCSNSMIKWENKNAESLCSLSDNDNDIKLLYMWDDKGICFCESSSANRIYSEIVQI